MKLLRGPKYAILGVPYYIYIEYSGPQNPSLPVKAPILHRGSAAVLQDVPFSGHLEALNP